MSDQRFTPQNKTTHERLSTNTVGLVNLDEYRKRRADVLEQQEREAREAAAILARGGALLPGTNAASNSNANSNAPTPPDRSLTGTPNNAGSEAGKGDVGSGAEKKSLQPQTKKRKVNNKRAKALISFGDEVEDEEEEESGPVLVKKNKKTAAESTKEESTDKDGKAEGGNGVDNDETGKTKDGAAASEGKSETEKTTTTTTAGKKKKITPNTSVGILPIALTKAARKREEEEREALRKEFHRMQAAVKATEIAIPFVFYDGTNIPGGIVRVKKGDHIWLFLDKSRKVGADRNIGGDKVLNARRAWARVSVDDLMLVRGTIIIPHHLEFYYFIMERKVGPGGKLLFDYSAEAPPQNDPSTTSSSSGATNNGAGGGIQGPLTDPTLLEGIGDDPTFTKVVDRRWYQRNKHIYPASMWQEFDPDKDYTTEIRRDLGGNAFFFAR